MAANLVREVLLRIPLNVIPRLKCVTRTEPTAVTADTAH